MTRYIALTLLCCAQLHAMSLFRALPTLEQTISIEHIANLPTPITQCKHLEHALHHPHLYMKDDGLTGSDGLYGGNKVRKLEFLLGDAKKHNAKTIITYGCFGTNHGLATACYAHKLGYDCILMLKPQPNSTVVRNNLLLDHYFGATIQTFPNNVTRNAARDAVLQNDPDAYFFPTGGSIPLGALGFVNAAFELKEQIDQGLMPEPDYIYVALGSAGTTGGLLLGLKLAGLRSKICAIAVEPEDTRNAFEEAVHRLFTGTNELLHEHDANIPLVEFPHDQIIINKTLVGPEYGIWIPEGDQAMRVMHETEKVELEGTYSAKTLAAIMADIKNGVRTSDDVILFWNTYCGLDFSHFTRQVQYQDLNPEFHALFEAQA